MTKALRDNTVWLASNLVIKEFGRDLIVNGREFAAVASPSLPFVILFD